MELGTLSAEAWSTGQAEGSLTRWSPSTIVFRTIRSTLRVFLAPQEPPITRSCGMTEACCGWERIIASSHRRSRFKMGSGNWRVARLYCLGEQCVTRLNAVLKALSDSYPRDAAIIEIESADFASLSDASIIRHSVRYSSGPFPTACLNRIAKLVRDIPARSPKTERSSVAMGHHAWPSLRAEFADPAKQTASRRRYSMLH